MDKWHSGMIVVNKNPDSLDFIACCIALGLSHNKPAVISRDPTEADLENVYTKVLGTGGSWNVEKGNYDYGALQLQDTNEMLMALICAFDLSKNHPPWRHSTTVAPVTEGALFMNSFLENALLEMFKSFDYLDCRCPVYAIMLDIGYKIINQLRRKDGK